MSAESRWTRIRDTLWHPPRPHGEQPRERVVGPLELFYDLVIVVLVAQAAHHLAERLTWRGFGEYAAVFTLIWVAWFNGSLYHELHGRDDARGRIMFLIQILILVPLGSFIPGAGGAHGAAFAVTAGLLFAVLAGLWALAARGDSPGYRRLSRQYVAGTAAGAALLAASALLPLDIRLAVWGVLGACYLAGLAVTMRLAVTGDPLAAFAVTPAVIERFGLLIIIVLGETVTGVVDGLTGEHAVDARILATTGLRTV
jgi:low temperature requirement protein LtrA